MVFFFGIIKTPKKIKRRHFSSIIRSEVVKRKKNSAEQSRKKGPKPLFHGLKIVQFLWKSLLECEVKH